MSLRHAFAAVTLALLAASPAMASILSATGQTLKSKPSNAEYLRVTAVQEQLNTTMRDINGETVATGSIESQAPVVGERPYVIQIDGSGGSMPGNIGELVLTPGDMRDAGRISIDNGSNGRERLGRRGRHDDRNRRNDPYAAPEPSTWMLLGTGLAMLGIYAALRRRTATQR